MLIGITGRAGVGKDSVASIVQGLYPELNWQIKGFADKLRQAVSIFTGISPLHLKYQEVKESLMSEGWDDKTVRDFMISIGMIFRGKNENAWVNALMVDYRNIGPYKWNPGGYANTCLECTCVFYNGAKLQRVCQNCCATVGHEYPNWLIPDTRFPNELEAITSRGGICIRVVRPDNPYPKSNHISETALDDVELLTIINDGNLDQLRIKVKEVFDPIVHRIRSGGISVA